ncbi:precorrin-3B synthase [Pirellula staleyi DSM 6068]|uniref:Precorrin-3B synthase n=1 Tax=Pirellula staleyi (strain ATCC 27377 / DSM 6068 / ICPB 4128) TaxID=530564 RepID=D2R302_PIRSD|nr:NirA family protein [Pirellula staleyi]ADB18735.1 precorrin-3B synthase [Pirellula staleyi DSM 6068]
MNAPQTFSEEQQQYLMGFAAGCDALQTSRNPTFASTLSALGMLPATTPETVPSPLPPDARLAHGVAQNQFLDRGLKLSSEEQAKRSKDPFQMRDAMEQAASEARFPKGTDVFLYKYHGLFHVAPAQNAFMCRLRFAGGMTNSHQFRGIADIAEKFAGGYTDVTTRSNLQLREIPAEYPLEVIDGLVELGVITRGSGADNIRNITIPPTSGIDPEEIIDTRTLARKMNHYILQHPEMYGLPRKFNISFDGGGRTTTLADTNDIGFFAVRGSLDGTSAPEIFFRMELGGITGHGDFASDCGILLRECECVDLAAAVLRVFLQEGDRTDRKRARLKYVLDRLGQAEFLKLVEKSYGKPLRQVPREYVELPRTKAVSGAHLGFHPQAQPGLHYVGVVLPVGRLSAQQMRDLAQVADRYGSGTIRLTVWQNLLISDIKTDDIPAVQAAIEATGLCTSATNVRSGLVACTGAAGCKFAAAHTKQHALKLATYLESKIQLDLPVNIHLTGCHHSCAQHAIGDIGLLGTKVAQGEEMVEGYHLFVGGGFGDDRGIGRQLQASIPATEMPSIVERLLIAWNDGRDFREQTFADWSRKRTLDELTRVIANSSVAMKEVA